MNSRMVIDDKMVKTLAMSRTCSVPNPLTADVKIWSRFYRLTTCRSTDRKENSLPVHTLSIEPSHQQEAVRKHNLSKKILNIETTSAGIPRSGQCRNHRTEGCRNSAHDMRPILGFWSGRQTMRSLYESKKRLLCSVFWEMKDMIIVLNFT